MAKSAIYGPFSRLQSVTDDGIPGIPKFPTDSEQFLMTSPSVMAEAPMFL